MRLLRVREHAPKRLRRGCGGGFAQRKEMAGQRVTLTDERGEDLTVGRHRAPAEVGLSGFGSDEIDVGGGEKRVHGGEKGGLKDLIRRIVWRAVFESENRVTKMRIKGQQDDGG